MSEEVTPWRKVQTEYVSRNTTPSRDNKLEWVEVPGGRLYRTWISHKTGCSVAMEFVATTTTVEATLRLEIERVQAELLETQEEAQANRDFMNAAHKKLKDRACTCIKPGTGIVFGGGHSDTCPVREDVSDES